MGPGKVKVRGLVLAFGERVVVLIGFLCGGIENVIYLASFGALFLFLHSSLSSLHYFL